MMVSLFLLQLFAGILSLFWLFESGKNKKEAIDVFTWLIIVFGSVRILSIIFSDFPSVSYQAFYKDALFYLAFFSMSFYIKVLDKERIKKIILAFIAGAVLVSIIGLIQFNLKVVDRAQAFSSGYATYSSFLLAALGLFVVSSSPNSEKNEKLFWLLGISFLLSGIIASQGRTNIAVAGLVFVAGLVLKKFNLKSAVLIIIVTSVISLISFSNNRKEITERVENPTTLSDRNIIWKGFKELAFTHPVLGFGPRTFHNIFPYKNELADKGIGSWHNDFVQVYFESGLIGLLSFLAIIAAAIYYGLKIIRSKQNNEEEKNFTLGILLSVTALILSAITAGFIDSPVLSIEFAFFLSLFSLVLFSNDGKFFGNKRLS
ncbi:MAG TPA: O-antigen ligase family protein [Ignavibacteriaceae bacterium]|nr:O-antigen ligase family protein [Ignavibacteriaceae bacterium]